MINNSACNRSMECNGFPLVAVEKYRNCTPLAATNNAQKPTDPLINLDSECVHANPPQPPALPFFVGGLCLPLYPSLSLSLTLSLLFSAFFSPSVFLSFSLLFSLLLCLPYPFPSLCCISCLRTPPSSPQPVCFLMEVVD